MSDQYTPLDEIRPDQPAPTPRTDAFPVREIERAIDEALHPKGMSTHCGKATLDASHVQRVLKVSRMLERELSAKTAEADRLREALKHELNALNLVLTRQRDGEVCRVSVSDLLQGIRLLEQALAATRKDPSNG